MELIAEATVTAAGGFLAWVFLRMILPFRIPDRLMPAVMAALTYGLLGMSWKFRLALAAGTGIILLHRLTLGLETPGPWHTPRVRRPVWTIRHPGSHAQPTGQGFRPGGGKGRRIPEL